MKKLKSLLTIPFLISAVLCILNLAEGFFIFSDCAKIFWSTQTMSRTNALERVFYFISRFYLIPFMLLVVFYFVIMAGGQGVAAVMIWIRRVYYMPFIFLSVSAGLSIIFLFFFYSIPSFLALFISQIVLHTISLIILSKRKPEFR